MLEWIEGLITALGYPGILVFMFLENIIPPIPSELIMPLAGFAVSKDQLSFTGVVLAGMLGSVLGALPFYYLGRTAGEARLRGWAARYGRWLMVAPEDVEKAAAWFGRHGYKMVLFGRLIPGIRTYVSIPAGMARMRLLPFLVYTAIGSGVWAALLTYAGVLLGANYERIGEYLGPVGQTVLIGLAVLIFIWFAWRYVSRCVLG